MRLFKGVAKAVVLVALLALVNVALTFALEVHGSQSQLMWLDYQEQEDMDTVVVGSSMAQRSIDPAVLDDELGCTSFNMGTPLQGIEETLVSIRTAVEDHHVRRVVLQVGYGVLQDANGPNPGSTFLVQRSRAVSPQEALGTLSWCLFDQGAWTTTNSVNWLFPWIANHVKLNPGAVAKNVRAKLDGVTPVEGSKIVSKKFEYMGRGFGADEATFDVDNAIFRVFGNKKSNSTEFVDDRLETLEEICTYCADNGVDLVAIATPLPAYNVLVYGDTYFEEKERLDGIFQQHGVDYLDFSLSRPELFEASNDLYADYEHLNLEGAGRFSHALASVLKSRDEGEDVSRLFYSEAEFASALDGLYAVDMDGVRGADGIRLEAIALAGTRTEVEYQFCVKKGAKKNHRGKVRKTSDKGWKTLQDYSPDPTCLFAPDKRGKYTLRVNVREKGSDVRYERYREIDVVY